MGIQAVFTLAQGNIPQRSSFRGKGAKLSVCDSWNKDLAHDRGVHMGSEFRTKGVNVALGPVVGPLGRVALGGRNWEGISNDPYLGGALVYETISGIQSNGVITSTKACIVRRLTNSTF
jgi:beta-glucosidase